MVGFDVSGGFERGLGSFLARGRKRGMLSHGRVGWWTLLVLSAS